MKQLLYKFKSFITSSDRGSTTMEKMIWIVVIAIAVTTISVGVWTHLNTAAETVTNKIDSVIQ